MSSPAVSEGFRVPVGDRMVEIGGSLEGRHVERVVRSSPREHPRGTLRLRIGADLASWIRFQSGFTGTAGGSPRDPAGAGFFDFDRVPQDISPSARLEEAYLDVFLDAVDLRIGVQKLAWGKLDGTQPNDVLNPERFRDPILEEEDDRKVGIPAASATVYLPDLPGGGRFLPEDLRLTGVWVPIVMPFSFPDVDERWYPPLARIPRRLVRDGFEIENETFFRSSPLPSRDLSNGGGAARLAGFFHGLDFALYFYDGYDSVAGFDAEAEAFVTFEPLNPGCLSPGPFPSPVCFDVRSEIDVLPRFQRIRSFGADAAYNLLGATLRVEAAYVKNRLYPRSIRDVVTSQQIEPVGILLRPGREQEVPVTIDPVSVRRDGVEWGAGGDYFFGRTFFLVEVLQTIVLDNDVDLLISDTETRLATTVRRPFLDDRLEAELIGLWGVQGVYGVAHGRITYDLTDALDVRVGYLLIEGHRSSLLGQYKSNDQGYVRLRYSF